ncbi:AMP-binding protein [filamentous cyanobacterium LEGE 11480]|uniref:AMP-binding protein n=1 Tax=Romeriopsis navalis LEGE 11480 TaxID=2777977 RepID=A0A928Z373_9CYAN|nr:AMP-binding protein [Romeriopsis navalis]MBE9028878.1 AMP-binding protein [Romeriopsis navalis LEGE 11480]
MNAWDYLQNHTDQPWLWETPTKILKAVTQKYFRTLTQLDAGQTIILAERDPIKFLAFWVAAASTPHRLILANPDWQTSEWQQVYQFIQPDIIIGNAPRQITIAPLPKPIEQLPEQVILIPTGGTSGQIKFAIHTWETITAAVIGLQNFLRLPQINACCVLPLYHVSGLMQAIRALITGGTIATYNWPALKAGSLPAINTSDYVLSLVPTQLTQLLEASATKPQILDFLQPMQAIFLGGAPAWPSLLERARHLKLPIAPTYGMTETLGQIATLKPEEFLAGQTGCGQLLPHANITIQAEHGAKPGTIGQLKIQADSQMRGYFPVTSQPSHANAFYPDDLGYFDTHGYLHIVGRNSDKIISGGENIFPAEIEAAIRATAAVTDTYVLGLPDERWGEIVTAIIVPTTPTSNPAPLINRLKTALSTQLSQHKQPKHWLIVDHLPRQPNGKLTKTTIESWLTDAALER